MAGFLEFNVKGGAKAYIELAAIRGFITSPGHDAGTVAEVEAPLSLVLANGGEVHTYGTSVAEIILRASELKKYMNAYGHHCGISWSDCTMSGEGGYAPDDLNDRRAPQTL